MTETLATAATTALARSTDSPPPCVKQVNGSIAVDLPQTTEEARSLRAWAETYVEQRVNATPEQIVKHLTAMSATLPSRSVDIDAGKTRVAVYTKFLLEWPNEALAYMSRRACAEMDWFPTPKQCLDLLKCWTAPAGLRDRAFRYCDQFWQMRHDEWIARLAGDDASPDDLTGVPANWLSIAEERGLLRRMDDGSFVIRSIWHGPRKPSSVAMAAA